MAALSTGSVKPDVDAQSAFSMFARSYGSPFSLILAADIAVSPSERPAGSSALVTVTGRAVGHY